eukprot:753522-Hanusia_phi.AAC.6
MQRIVSRPKNLRSITTVTCGKREEETSWSHEYQAEQSAWRKRQNSRGEERTTEEEMAEKTILEEGNEMKREEMKREEMKSEEMKSEEMKREEMKSEEMKSEEMKREEEMKRSGGQREIQED